MSKDLVTLCDPLHPPPTGFFKLGMEENNWTLRTLTIAMASRFIKFHIPYIPTEFEEVVVVVEESGC